MKKETFSRKTCVPQSTRRQWLKTASRIAAGIIVGADTLSANLQKKEKAIMQGELKDWKTVPELKSLREAFAFLEEPKTKTLPEGKYPIRGEEIFAVVSHPLTQPPEERKYEAHRKYIDVQFLFEGEEQIRVTPLDGLVEAAPFDAEKDIVFYQHNREYRTILLQPGRYAVFFPPDAHMPLCLKERPQKLRKVVVKIAVEYYQKML